MNKKTFFIFLLIFSFILLLFVALLPRVEEIKPYKEPPQKKVFEVSSLLDQGDHTLREAIVEVNKAQRPVSIQFKVSGAILLEGPLPPLLNKGTTIAAQGTITIDGRRLSKDGFLWTIRGQDQTLSGITFSGQRNKGLLVLANNSRIEGCTFQGFDTAVTLGGNNVTVENALFSANKRGVELLEGAQFARIFSNEFKGNQEAGLWAVWPGIPQEKAAFLKAVKNHFSSNGTGMVLFLDRAEIEKNVIFHNDKGVHLLNAKNIKLQQNDIYQNREHGIIMEGAVRSQVAENKLYQNGIAGILMNRSVGNLLAKNQIFSNGAYGVAEVLSNVNSSFLPNHIKDNLISDNGDGVYIQAASPILEGNTIKQNRLSGVKISDYAAGEKRYHSDPRIENQGIVDPIVRKD